MKKVLKIFGIVLGSLVVILLIVGVYISIRGVPTYDIPEVEFIADHNPVALERGRVLTMTLCANCHMNKETGEITGSRLYDAPTEFGMIYSANITQDKKYGIGEWTDGELLRLLRTGVKRDGKYAPPYMTKLPMMSDTDINAIIAFLRSDHEIVKARPVVDRECEPTFLTKMLCNTVMKPFPMPTGPISHPDTNDIVEHGKYLAVNLDCFSCHSADFKTNDFIIPENSVGYFGGGNPTLNMDGEVVFTANLTPDNETGLGKWSEKKFVDAVKYGQVEGGPALRYPMAPYVHLTDKEVSAIFAYLNTIPPIANHIER